jgi:hypothetical protein
VLLGAAVAVLGVTAVAHPRDGVVCPVAVASIAAVRFPWLIVIDAAATLGALV